MDVPITEQQILGAMDERTRVGYHLAKSQVVNAALEVRIDELEQQVKSFAPVPNPVSE